MTESILDQAIALQAKGGHEYDDECSCQECYFTFSRVLAAVLMKTENPYCVSVNFPSGVVFTYPKEVT